MATMRAFGWLLFLFAIFTIQSSQRTQAKVNVGFIADYYLFKDVKYVVAVVCWTISDSKSLSKSLISSGIRPSVISANTALDVGVKKVLNSDITREGLGVILDTDCDESTEFLRECSRFQLFNDTYKWLILTEPNSKSNELVEDVEHYDIFKSLANYNMCVDAEITVAIQNDNELIHLYDVFNHGFHLGGRLNVTKLGKWESDRGLLIELNQPKYERRANFHLVQLRIVTVLLTSTTQEKIFDLLTTRSFEPGVNTMTKISSEFVGLAKEIHNYSVFYIVEDRWAGVNDDGSHVGLMGVFQRHEADICSTAFRMWDDRIDHVTFFSSVFKFGSAFFFRNPMDGFGPYRNEFFKPFALNAWAACLIAAVLCCLALAVARPTISKMVTGFFEIVAIFSQQEFIEGPESHKDIKKSTKIKGHNSARIIIFVTCLTSLVLYNYYTSAVVSFLLSAVPATIQSLPELISSRLEIIFEDIGYTRSLIDNPNFFFQSKWHQEERRLVKQKVKIKDRSKPIYVPVDEGIELVRQGGYAYHTEHSTAYPEILKRFDAAEICDLSSLLAIPPTDVYLATQRNSPYTEIFAQTFQWLRETGHLSRAQRVFSSAKPECKQTSILSAVSLGGAAPALAFLVLAGWVASFLLLAMEKYLHRKQQIKQSDAVAAVAVKPPTTFHY